ncbi:MAG: hypothetical protein KAT37_00390 [Candidatus Aenigmarchaeota archaeon]|nr:hypothetical protein [Candidatus Aenigmarchaeota archaeon]
MQNRLHSKYHPDLAMDMSSFPLRDMQDLVKIRKPVVMREGRIVKDCNFYKTTGQCFGTRCFWVRNGECPFFNKKTNAK